MKRGTVLFALMALLACDGGERVDHSAQWNSHFPDAGVAGGGSAGGGGSATGGGSSTDGATDTGSDAGVVATNNHAPECVVVFWPFGCLKQ